MSYGKGVYFVVLSITNMECDNSLPSFKADVKTDDTNSSRNTDDKVRNDTETVSDTRATYPDKDHQFKGLSSPSMSLVQVKEETEQDLPRAESLAMLEHFYDSIDLFHTVGSVHEAYWRLRRLSHAFIHPWVNRPDSGDLNGEELVRNLGKMLKSFHTISRDTLPPDVCPMNPAYELTDRQRGRFKPLFSRTCVKKKDPSFVEALGNHQLKASHEKEILHRSESAIILVEELCANLCKADLTSSISSVLMEFESLISIAAEEDTSLLKALTPIYRCLETCGWKSTLHTWNREGTTGFHTEPDKVAILSKLSEFL